LFDVADAVRRQQLQSPLHFEHGVAQRVGGLLRVGDHWREQVRNAFIQTEFEPLRIHHDHAHLVRRGFVQDRHDQRVEHHALARSRRSGD
jgi:hypothetical protein